MERAGNEEHDARTLLWLVVLQQLLVDPEEGMPLRLTCHAGREAVHRFALWVLLETAEAPGEVATAALPWQG